MKTPDAGNPVRWALAGFGSGGRVFHAPLLAMNPATDFVAVVTRDSERRQQVAQTLPGVQCVDSINDLPGLDVQAVTISTPPATHQALAQQAIAAGLHVVVDKPFALTEADTMTIIDFAERHRLLIAPYHNRRFDDDFLTLQNIVATGKLGPVHHFVSQVNRSRPIKPGWPSLPEAGGGLLLDLGPHLIDQALTLLGPAVSLWARLDMQRHGATTEDSFTLELLHGSGARSSLSASLAAPAEGPRFLVQGRDAGVRIEGFDIQEAQLKSGRYLDDSEIEFGVDATRIAEITDTNGSRQKVPLLPGNWQKYYAQFASAIHGHGPLPVSTQAARDVAQIIDLARRSAEHGETLSLAQTFEQNKP